MADRPVNESAPKSAPIEAAKPDDSLANRLAERFNKTVGTAGHILSGEAQKQFKHLYVNPRGSDRGQCTADLPCKTIGRAADLATAGTTIDIAPGIYPERVNVHKSGTANEPIVLKGAAGEQKAIIDLAGKGCDGERNEAGIDAAIDLSNSRHVVVDGLVVRNMKAGENTCTPTGVFAGGITRDLTIKNMEITAIEAAPKKDGHAHGIAIIGNGKDQSQATANIKIESNYLHDLKLGGSEGLAINGNVDGFSVSNNTLLRFNNIAIDLIGAEGKAPKAVDIARNGKVIGNRVDSIDSYGNPAYGKSRSAGGIYVDGGQNIEIARNTVTSANYGVSLGSEHNGGSTSGIWLHHNIIADSDQAGLDIGGYDESLGSATRNLIEHNRFVNNDRRGSEEGQILFQNNAFDNLFRNNTFEKTRNCKPTADYGKNNVRNRFINNKYDCGSD